MIRYNKIIEFLWVLFHFYQEISMQSILLPQNMAPAVSPLINYSSSNLNQEPNVVDGMMDTQNENSQAERNQFLTRSTRKNKMLSMKSFASYKML